MIYVSGDNILEIQQKLQNNIKISDFDTKLIVWKL